MKVVLSGTSNSIIANGISAALAKHPLVTEFRNASYGASGSVAIADHLSQVDFSDFDICVIDYCVNEEVYLTTGVTQLADALSNVCNLLDQVSRAGCLPVMLILPSVQRMGFPRQLETAIMELLVPYAVPVFNAYSYIETLATKYGIDPQDFFLDLNHIHRELSAHIGSELVNYLANFDLGKIEIVETGIGFRSLSFIPFQEIGVSGGATIVHHETRLMSSDFLAVTDGAVLQVTDDEDKILVGVGFNAARSWGSLEVDGQLAYRCEHKNLFTTRRGMTKICVPVLRQVSGTSDGLVLTYRQAPISGDDRPAVALELSGLVLMARQNDRALAICQLDGVSRQIESSVSEEREQEMITALRSVILAARSS